MSKEDPNKKSHIDLSAAEVSDIEQKLLSNPKDLVARMCLIKHYVFAAAGPKGSAQSAASLAKDPRREEQKLEEHAAWIISNCPDSQLAAELHFYVLPSEHPTAYSHCEQLWLEILDAKPDDPAILENAARFCLAGKPEMSRMLIERGQQLNPESEVWSELLELNTALQSGSPVALLENLIVSLKRKREEAAREGKVHLVQFTEEEIRKCESQIKDLQSD